RVRFGLVEPFPCHGDRDACEAHVTKCRPPPQRCLTPGLARAGAGSSPLLTVRPHPAAAARTAARAGRRRARAIAPRAACPWLRAARGRPGSAPSAVPALPPGPAPPHPCRHTAPGPDWLVL